MSEDPLPAPQPSPAAAPERRSSPRLACTGSTCCCWHDPASDSDQLVGIRDLALGGVGLVLPMPFEAGVQHRLRLENRQRGCEHARTARVVAEPICMPNDAWLHGYQFDRPLLPDELAQLVS
jgi:hypothetical protein